MPLFLFASIIHPSIEKSPWNAYALMKRPALAGYGFHELFLVYASNNKTHNGGPPA
jgi:hypothetical protein